jgi:predicted secreted protein
MSVTLGAAIFFIIWWTVLFAVLPLGVRTQGEAGEVVPGTPESAPVRPRFLRIVALTTLLAAIIFAVVWSMIFWQVIDLGRHASPVPGPVQGR